MTEFIVKYWLEVTFTGILGVLTLGFKKFSKSVKSELAESITKEVSETLVSEIEDQKILKLAMQAMLRDRLIQSYNYFIEKGCCAIHDRDNVINMYNQYHNLGANGVIDGLMYELMELPVANKKC